MLKEVVFIENGFDRIERMDLSGNLTPDQEFRQHYEAYVTERNDLETPHTCDAELNAPDAGAPLDELETHAEEFHKLVEEMFEKLPTETRILEGIELPTYDDLRTQLENELSEINENEDNGQCAGSMDS
jgi:hypothetical protein